jgi:hypothetical protein
MNVIWIRCISSSFICGCMGGISYEVKYVSYHKDDDLPEELVRAVDIAEVRLPVGAYLHHLERK